MEKRYFLIADTTNGIMADVSFDGYNDLEVVDEDFSSAGLIILAMMSSSGLRSAKKHLISSMKNMALQRDMELKKVIRLQYGTPMTTLIIMALLIQRKKREFLLKTNMRLTLRNA